MIASFTLNLGPAWAENIKVHNGTVSSFCIGWTQEGLVDRYVLNVTNTDTYNVDYGGDNRSACVTDLTTAGKAYTFILTGISGELGNASTSEARTSK